MNRKLNTKEIGQLLDHAAARLDQETLDKLWLPPRHCAINKRE
jgi:hypothetical protein